MRMFEMANDYCRQNTNFEVVAGYLSPVGDKYVKQGLLSAPRRSESSPYPDGVTNSHNLSTLMNQTG